TVASLPPVTAAVLAVLLAGCLWLTLRPPRWLLPDRHARRFGVGMAVALVAGFVLTNSRHEVGDPPGSEGMVFYLLIGPILVVLTGSAAAAAVGRSFRSGVWACAWAAVLGAPLLVAAWLAEALRWYQQGQGTALDGAGVNLGDAVWWPLVFLALWVVPLGVVGAAFGNARAHRQPRIQISHRDHSS
ncbi:MAG TPA: hypothetical protein VJ735_19715, partial [Actinomycetes bacterium]|nr:hypothetical protein [Actinomycetes bacterium]